MIRHLFCLIYILVHPKCRWGAGAFQCWERIKCFRSRCHQYEGGANVCSSCQRKSQPRLKCRHNPGFNPIPKLSVALTEVHRVQSTGKTFPAFPLWSEAAPAGVSTLQYYLIWTLEPLQGVVLGTLQSLSQSRELEPSIALQLRSQWYYHQLHNLNWGWWCLSVCRGVVL